MHCDTQFTYRNALAGLAKQNRVIRLALVHGDRIGYIHSFDDDSITLEDVGNEALTTYFMPHIISFELA